MAVFTLGIVSITIGDIAGDGGPGTSLASLGLTNQDSCKLTQDDPETTDFFAEEQDAAVYTSQKAGAVSLALQIMNPDTDTLVALFGGSVTSNTWNMPATIPTIEKTVKLTPKQGLTLIIPRGSITAKLNGEFSKKNLFLIDVTIKALVPSKSGVGPVQFIKVPVA